MCADIFTKDLSDDIYARHATLMQGLTPDAQQSYTFKFSQIHSLYIKRSLMSLGFLLSFLKTNYLH